MSFKTRFLLCWQQKVKQILYFDKMNKNNKYAFLFLFFYKLTNYLFFLSATILVLTIKCKTNFIPDKTNKINGLQ